MVKDLVYNLFIVNAWGIVLITMFYTWVFKTLFPTHKKLAPLFCVLFGFIFIICVPYVDSPFTNSITKISDVIYDILAPIGLYELISCIYEFIKERKKQK